MHPRTGVNVLLNGKVVARTVSYGQLFRLNTAPDHTTCAYKVNDSDKLPKPSYDVAHRRLGHLEKTNVLKVEKLADGIEIDPTTIPDEDTCEECTKGK